MTLVSTSQIAYQSWLSFRNTRSKRDERCLGKSNKAFLHLALHSEIAVLPLCKKLMAPISVTQYKVSSKYGLLYCLYVADFPGDAEALRLTCVVEERPFGLYLLGAQIESKLEIPSRKVLVIVHAMSL